MAPLEVARRFAILSLAILMLVASKGFAGDAGFLPGDAFFQCWFTGKSMGELQDDDSILFRESHANHRYFDNLLEGIQREVMQPAIHAWSIHAMT